MPIQKEKFVEFDNRFYSIFPNRGHCHFVFVVDKYGKSYKVATIKTKDLPEKVIELIRAEAPQAELHLE
jgi:hypothetical protein